ncbi:MAG: cupin domain-containing protein [Bacteroidota bacterium]
MKLTPENALEALQAVPEKFATLFTDKTLEIEIYKPEKVDPQQPHKRDEIYVIISGTGTFYDEGKTTNFKPGDLLFVPAGNNHRFQNFTDDFSTWVIFYGPEYDVDPKP